MKEFDIEKHLTSLKDQMAAASRSLSMIKGVHLGPNHQPVKETDLSTAVSKLATAGDAVNWKLGDWISAAKVSIGPMAAYRIAASQMNRSVRLAFELAKIAEAFGPELRYAKVPWALYRACANTGDPKGMLAVALQENLTPAGVRKRAGRSHTKDKSAKDVSTLFDLA
jgi:hypothetical protein